MAGTTPQHQIPNFVSSFKHSDPFFYFHHIINPDEATIEVEVIGPNLRFTFHHSQAKALMPRSGRLNILEPKTTGFIALIRGSNRHILAWAESGHGSGRLGDHLDAPPGSPVLPNKLWTRRVVQLGTLLGFKMASPFDRPGIYRPRTKEDVRGIYAGSHVEVKLTAFAICFLLKTFDITKDFDNIKQRQLRKLRLVRWQDGTRPAFEIYFSRKNCDRCGALVKALSDFTGISIALNWKVRLTEKLFDRAHRSAKSLQKRVLPIIEDESSGFEDAIIIEDDEDSDVSTPSVPGSKNSAIMIEDGVGPVDLITPLNSPCARAEATNVTGGAGEFIRSMAEYAEKVNCSPINMGSTRVGRQARDLTRHEERGINKPLPATPAKEFPNCCPADESTSRQNSHITFYPCPTTRSTSPKRDNQQPGTGVRGRSLRRYQLRGSERIDLPAPNTVGEMARGREIGASQKMSPGETLTKTPTRDKRGTLFTVEIRSKPRSRSPSPFDF